MTDRYDLRFASDGDGPCWGGRRSAGRSQPPNRHCPATRRVSKRIVRSSEGRSSTPPSTVWATRSIASGALTATTPNGKSSKTVTRLSPSGLVAKAMRAKRSACAVWFSGRQGGLTPTRPSALPSSISASTGSCSASRKRAIPTCSSGNNRHADPIPAARSCASTPRRASWATRAASAATTTKGPRLGR